VNPWSIALGAIVTGALSYSVVPWLIDYVENQVRKQLSDRNESVGPRLPGGDVLGYLECALFFGSLLWAGGAVLIAAWLAYRTAAKWKVWESTKDVKYTEVQTRYRLFLVGTAANIVAALAGVAVAHLP
jgi:hypothetical protein